MISLNITEKPKQTNLNLPGTDSRPPGWIRSTCFQSIAICCVNRSCGKQSMNTSKVCRERERSSTSVRLNFICDIVSTPQNHKTDFNCHHVTVLWPVSLSAVLRSNSWRNLIIYLTRQCHGSRMAKGLKFLPLKPFSDFQRREVWETLGVDAHACWEVGKGNISTISTLGE